MDAISFISKTKELIPNEDKIRKKFTDEFFVRKILNNYISIKNPNSIIEIEDPISFILINCDYSNFSTNPITKFIEPIEISHFTIFGETDLGYIGVNNFTKIIFKISYEPIAEYLYGDGIIPDFDNITLIAKDKYCLLDAIVYWLELHKIVMENDETSINTFANNEVVNSFLEKSLIAAGGAEFEFQKVF